MHVGCEDVVKHWGLFHCIGRGERLSVVFESKLSAAVITTSIPSFTPLALNDRLGYRHSHSSNDKSLSTRRVWNRKMPWPKFLQNFRTGIISDSLTSIPMKANVSVPYVTFILIVSGCSFGVCLLVWFLACFSLSSVGWSFFPLMHFRSLSVRGC